MAVPLRVPIPSAATRLGLRLPETETDLSDCAYFRALRCGGPSAVCSYSASCWEAGEPMCVTFEPECGWPSMRGSR